ncbi:SDR family NAD(P)-dependent oxidoreductase [Blastococcus capsensis]|uniref:SDR family NAD(P)-dependent oxidoreductase n=1 Tax=Blastococcus capsensis TaxID=1564163 RepID=UPI002541B3C1|nr:SDR family oxidoreductase [Blastococcus capsensis]MDK3258043.1 SDR family oxidoreductase [Blastococcus capsensis]MDK3258058.1 SDR family oxidoreductase [Blastococcus capsensis]
MGEKGPRPPHPSHAQGGSRDGAALSGAVALVTGASTGIGRHLVEGLAARGMAVAGLARTEGLLRTAMAEVADATGGRTLAVAADVTDRASVEAAVGEVREQLGPVDLLVNNAGLIDEYEVPVWEADPDQWWEVVSSHIRGAQLTIRTLVPWMVLRNRGRVVNIASGMSTRANPDYSAYAVAKTGLMRLTESLATALEGSDVHAFDVAPGVVDTPMTRSMHMWQGNTSWTPPERVVEIIAAIAAGELDAWSGRFLRAGADDLETLRSVAPDGAARRLRLRPYGDADPLG